MLRVGIDNDGVVADFRSAFRRLAERELGIAAEDAESDLTTADIDRLWRAVADKPNWWLDVPSYEPEYLSTTNFQLPRAKVLPTPNAQRPTPNSNSQVVLKLKSVTVESCE